MSFIDSDDHFIGWSQPFPESFQRRPGHVNPARMLQYPRIPNHHLPEGPVDIHANYASHKHLLSAKMTGAAGDTTTTDPRSQRNRVSRRGGQLTNSSSQLIEYFGLPALSCSRCLCPGWSHHIPRRRVAVGT